MTPNRTKTAVKAGAGVGLTGAAAALILAMVTPMVQKHEGIRTKAYLDPVGIATICYGETRGVKMGDVKTLEECRDMLWPRLQEFLVDMRECTEVDLPAKTETAFLSFAYNLGSSVYCRNIAEKRINAGKLLEACLALKLYTRAGGKVWPGLVRRRNEESALCVEGLEEAGLV